MKILKFLFTKTTVIVLLFFLQVYLLIASAVYFYDNFFIIQVVTTVIGLLMLLYTINKKSNPEVKLPWIIMFLLVPVVGIPVYFMFAEPKVKKKRTKLLKGIFTETSVYLSNNENGREKLKTTLNNRYGFEQYLNKTSYTTGRLYNKVTYLNSGEEFFEDLLIELEKATDFIFLEYFVIARGYMWDKIHEILARKSSLGVDVRVIYDHIGSLGRVKDGFKRQLEKENIKCVKFNPIVPIVSGIYNNRDHRKITVIDGKVAYTGGANIGDEYINKKKRFGHWKDSAIKVQGPSVKDFTAMFLQLFDMEKNQKSDYEKFLTVPTKEFKVADKNELGYVHFFGDGPKPIYNEPVGEYNYLNILNSAKERVLITTPYLILDYQTMETLRTVANKGVDVKIILPHIPDKKIVFNMTRSNYKHLLKAGVKIYEYTPGFLHAKTMIADGEVACIGTINLDYRSFLHHYECGALIMGSSAIKDAEKDFNEILEKSQEITLENYKMNIFARLINSVLKLFSPLL